MSVVFIRLRLVMLVVMVQLHYGSFPFVCPAQASNSKTKKRTKKQNIRERTPRP